MQQHGRALEHGSGGDVHDFSVFLPLHMRYHRLDRLKDTANIHGHQPIPLFGFNLEELFEREITEQGGVGDQNIEPPEGSDGIVHCFTDRLRFGHISDSAKRASAAILNRVDCRGRISDVVDRYQRAFGGKRASVGGTNTLCGSLGQEIRLKTAALPLSYTGIFPCIGSPHGFEPRSSHSKCDILPLDEGANGPTCGI
jgi:hypothetical protein